MVIDLLIDTGADETFLYFSFIKKLNLNTEGIDVRDDVGGVGVSVIPYSIESKLKRQLPMKFLIRKIIVMLFSMLHLLLESLSTQFI